MQWRLGKRTSSRNHKSPNLKKYATGAKPLQTRQKNMTEVALQLEQKKRKK